MPLHRIIGLVCLVVLATSACSRLTFVRPNAKAGDYEKIAPTYTFEASPEVAKRTEARDHIVLAANAARAGKIDEAEKEARSTLKIDPASADAYTILAVVEDRRNNSEKAGGYYGKAAELAPAQGATLNNYGAWLCGNGREAESINWFDRALKDPGYRQRASAMANAGACALASGSLARVDQDLRGALALDPSNPTALAAMADYQYRTGDYMTARAFSERRLAAGPATAQVLQLASQIEEKLGDRTAANRYVQRLQTEFPQAGTLQSGEKSQQ